MQNTSFRERFPQLFSGLFALSLALVAGSFIGASAIRNLKQTDVVTVTGSAKRPIRSDYIIWRVSVPEVVNGRETGKILAYRLNQRYEIRSSEVERIAQLSQQATELINEGIPIVSEAPEYLYTQLSKLRVEMVADATKDAKARAEAIARSTGNRIGAVRSAKTGVFQITSRNSTAVSDSGIYDTSSVDKDITAVVSVEFGIE